MFLVTNFTTTEREELVLFAVPIISLFSVYVGVLPLYIFVLGIGLFAILLQTASAFVKLHLLDFALSKIDSIAIFQHYLLMFL